MTKPTPTLEDFRAVAATLKAGDHTRNGAPQMGALNAALRKAGFYTITAGERDHFMATAAPAPQEQKFVITDAPMNPVPVRFNGRLIASIRIGEPFHATHNILEVLRNSHATVEAA